MMWLGDTSALLGSGDDASKRALLASAAAIVGASGLLWATGALKSSRKPSDLLDAPGPPGVPVLGNVPQLMGKKDVHRILTKVAEWMRVGIGWWGLHEARSSSAP